MLFILKIFQIKRKKEKKVLLHSHQLNSLLVNIFIAKHKYKTFQHQWRKFSGCQKTNK